MLSAQTGIRLSSLGCRVCTRGSWEAVPGRQRKPHVQRAEVEREWSAWRIARTFVAGLGEGRRDMRGKQGPHVMCHVRERGFEFEDSGRQ